MREPAHGIRRPTAVVAACIVFAAMPSVALAQTDEEPPPSDRTTTLALDDRAVRSHDLGSAKERTLQAIDKRLEALERLSEAVVGKEHVRANHAAHLQIDYREATRILEEAADAVEGAQSFAELREIVPGVFGNTLVFALLRPKTHLVVASTSNVAIYERVDGFAKKLQITIDRLAARGHEMGTAQASLDEMVRLLDAAGALAEPIADAVIDLNPDDWPDPAQAALEQGRADLEAAQELFREARVNAREVVTAIREALSSE